MRSLLLAAMMIVTMAPVAQAQGLGLAPPVNTFSISYFGHMEVVTDGATSDVWALEDTGLEVAHHSATGPGPWTPVPNRVRDGGPIPRRVAVGFFPQTGLAAFDPAPGPGRGPGGARVYAVSVPAPRVPSLAEAQLWEFNTSTATWRSLSHYPGVSFGSSPAISAALIGGVRAWIAVRASNGHVYTCDYLDLDSPACHWTDLDPSGTHLAATSSDVAIVDGLHGPHILTVRATGIAEIYEYATRQWHDLPVPRTEWLVTPGGIAALSLSTPGNREIRLVAGGHVNGGQGNDSLFVATTRNGTDWVWEEMLAPGDGPFFYRTVVRNTVDIAARNISRSGRPNYDVAVYADAFGPEGQVFIPCLLPSRFGVVDGVRSCVSDVSDGALRTMPLPADLDPQTSFLGFSVAGVVLPPGQFGISSFRGFTTGILARVGYVYQFDSTADGLDQPIWSNLLTPRNPIVTLPGGQQEFSGDEFFGTVALMDTFGTVWRSLDDGNTWPSTTQPLPFGVQIPASLGGSRLPRACGDTNLGYDSAGNLYITSLANSFFGLTTQCRSSIGQRDSFADSILIARVPAGSPLGTPTTPLAIPSTRLVIPPGCTPTLTNNCAPMDRPWLAVRHDVPDFVFLTWTANQLGHLAYCMGSDCSAPTSNWCPTQPVSAVGPPGEGPAPPFALPSTCAGLGCAIAQAGDNNVWIAVDGDTACTDGLGAYAVGFRQILNLPLLDNTCAVVPLLSVPECIYFTAGPLMGQTQLVQTPGPTPGTALNPGLNARWGISLVGAPDTGDILFAAPAGVNLTTGAPCGPATTDPNCRIDVLLLRRDAATRRWCGRTDACESAPFAADHRFSANGDPMSQQQDHGLPVAAFYAYGQASAYWMDFRPSPLVPTPTSPTRHDDTLYYNARRLTRYGSGDTIVASAEVLNWPQALGVPVLYQVAPKSYLDVDSMATEALHSHEAHFFYSTGQVVTILSSPRDPPR